MSPPTSLTMKGILFLLTASQLWANSDSTFSECAEHPACLLEGIDEDGFCCPDKNGIYKDCCHRAECVVYPACYDAVVGGFCCPTVEGEFLDCCDDPANTAAPSLAPSQIPSSYTTPVIITANESPGACSRNAQCKALGLKGLCCPTNDNVHLDCCTAEPSFPTRNPSIQPSMNPSSSPSGYPSQSPSSAPSMNPSSSPSGYPSQSPSEVAGSAQCSANPTCASLGINGQCCPTSAGVQLDCCDQATSTTPTSPPTRNPSSSPSKNPTSTPTTSPSSSPSHSPTASSGPAQCSANPGCSTLGLSGDCCPTAVGDRLDCCELSDLSSSPSSAPSGPPTQVPSASPLPSPNDEPSNFLSMNPSDEPSSVPSFTPSDVPSQVPSHLPTQLPSNLASDEPSKVPSQIPSTWPSDQHSQIPSDLPTDSPAPIPSRSPSELAESAQCSANLACANLGLRGECCPTSIGIQLDCCDQAALSTPTPPTLNSSTTESNRTTPLPAECSAHADCASLGLDGDCCPTSTGVQLDCCDQAAFSIPTSQPTKNPSTAPSNSPTPPPTTPPTRNPSTAPSNIPTPSPVQCSANQACASLGLDGDCCPTSTGVQLDCCDQAAFSIPTSQPTKNPSTAPSNSPTPPPTTPPTRNPSTAPSNSPTPSPVQCSANPACASLGLAGECCPTSSGVQLGCCDQADDDDEDDYDDDEDDADDHNDVMDDDDEDHDYDADDDDHNQPTKNPSTAPSNSPTPPPTTPPTRNPSTAPSNSPNPSPVQCSANPACASLGLAGECCPTPSGSLLGCCDQAAVSTPTAAPSKAPTAENQLRFIADDNEVDLPEHSLGKCEADCDTDKDCEYGLVCFQRELGESDVPGCVGDASLVNDGDDDFCIEPPADTLVLVGDDGFPESAYPMGECQGDCDGDDDCGDGLFCFERDGDTTVPNCVGEGVGGYDYCYNPPSVLTFIGDYEMAYYELQLCQGDCDYDSDCALGLVCFQRGSADVGDVPGCDGDATNIATGAEDFCVKRPTSNWLNIVYDYEDDIGTYPIGRCSGDCESDEDCEGDLTCFKRDGEEPVPGCIGSGEEPYAYCI